MVNLETALRALPGLALNALLPPRCLSCGVGAERPGTLCHRLTLSHIREKFRSSQK